MQRLAEVIHHERVAAPVETDSARHEGACISFTDQAATGRMHSSLARHAPAPWRLHVFGTPRLIRGDQVVAIPSQVPQALGLVLALRADWVAREWLATLAWPDADLQTVQHNLRVNLHRLRAWLTGLGLAAALQQERRRLRLDLPTDLAEFRQALDEGDLERARQWQVGPLVQALVLPAFPAVEDWFAQQREPLAQAGRDIALSLASRLHDQGRTAEAMQLLAQRIDQDPLAEDLLQRLLALAAEGGDPTWARGVFERFRRRARQETGGELQAATLRLAAGLLHAGTATPDTAVAADEPPWIGRVELLRRLRVQSRRCALVLGDGGSGKSRLLRQANLGPAVVWLAGHESAATEPFAVLMHWMGQHLGQIRQWPHFTQHRRWLAALVPALVESETLPPARLQRPQVLQMLAALLHDQQALIVIDDLQWIDDGTAAVLSTLTARYRTAWIAAARPAALLPGLGTWLDSLQREGTLERIELAPWTAPEVESLLLRLGMAAASAQHLGGWLHRHAGGHPLFTLETVRHLRHQAGIAANATSWSVSPPEPGDDAARPTAAVLALVQQRAAGLGRQAAWVLAMAALAGDASDIKLLARALGLRSRAVAWAIGQAQQAGLLSGRQFTHDLMREAVRAGIPEAQRTEWHALLAEAAEAQGESWPAARIAEHWRAAGRWAGWAAQTLRSSQEERLRGLHAHAAARLDRLLAAELPAPWPARLAVERARCAWEAGEREQAKRWNQHALATNPDDQTRAEALLLHAQMALKSGSAVAAQGWLDEAGRHAPPWPRWLEIAASVAHQRGRFVEAERRYRELLAALCRQQPADADAMAIQAMALSNLGAALAAQGRLDESLPVHHQAMALARRMNANYLQVHLATNLMSPLFQLGRYDEAVATGQQALALGMYDGTSQLVNNLAGVLQAAGRGPEALRLNERLVDDVDPTLRCAALARRIRLMAQLGQAAPSPRAWQQLIEAMRATDVYSVQAMGMLVMLEQGQAGLRKVALGFLRQEPLPSRMQALLDCALQKAGADSDCFDPVAD